jgi:hypothetical protein
MTREPQSNCSPMAYMIGFSAALRRIKAVEDYKKDRRSLGFRLKIKSYLK